MARLRGPDAGSRYCYDPETGAPAAGLPAIIYADAGGTVPADIRVDNGSATPGDAIPGGVVQTDEYGQLPPIWYPPGLVARLWASVNGGPLFPIRANVDATALSVRAFGAVGNGVADDTAAIQAAIDSASTAGSSAESGSAGRGVVYLPAGDYKVSNLTLRSNVNIVGAGYRATTLIATTASGYVLDVSGLSNAARMANVLVSGITIGPTSSATGGLNASRPGCGGINLRYSQWCSLKDVFIHNLAGVGINLTSTYDLVTHGVHLLHTGTDYTTPALLMTGTSTDDGTNATHHFGMRIERCPVMIYATNSARRPFNNQFVGSKFEVHASGQVAVPGPPIWIEFAEQMTFTACHFVTDINTQPIIRGGATSGTQSCIGLKFTGCDWISPDRVSGWGFDGTALCVDPEFVGCHASGMAKGWTGVSGCLATFAGLTAHSCIAPVIDMIGPQISASRFLFTKLPAGQSNIYTLKVSSRARVIGSHVQGSTIVSEQPNGVSMSNDTLVLGNLLERLPVGLLVSGTNAEVRSNKYVSVTTTVSPGFDASNAVQTDFHPAVTGSRGGNAALASLLSALAARGDIIDSTTV